MAQWWLTHPDNPSPATAIAALAREGAVAAAAASEELGGSTSSSSEEESDDDVPALLPPRSGKDEKTDGDEPLSDSGGDEGGWLL